MPRVSFDELPDHGRMWVFPASRRLESHESDALLAEVDTFLEGWAAHGVPLRSSRRLVEAQFLVIGVDEDAEAPSGCSIDALVNRLRALGEEMDVQLIRHAPIWFRDGAGVAVVSRADFKAMARAGTVDAQTPVFDTSLTRLADFRGGKLERPARDSWHGRAFF